MKIAILDDYQDAVRKLDCFQLLAALGHAPATLEILAARTDMEDSTLQSTLLQLELAGRLTVLPGGRFARVSHS
jgi:DNA processing protein